MVLPGRSYPLAQEQPSTVLPVMDENQNAVFVPGETFAAVGMEAYPPAGIWPAEEANGAMVGERLLPFSAPLASVASSRQYGHNVGTDDGNHQNPTMATNYGVYQRPTYQQQQKERVLLGMDGYGGSGKSSGDDLRDGLGYGVGVGECWRMSNWKMVAGSPKSSVSSDGPRGDLAENSPSAVWEVDMPRGGTTRGGDGVPREKKRTVDAVAENGVGRQQLPMICVREPSAILCGDEQSVHDLKRLFLCAFMELESARTSAKEEIRKIEEKVVQLLQLLKTANRKRGEERDQLQELLNTVALPGLPQHAPSLLYLQPESPSVELTRCASRVTEFDRPSCTHSYKLCPYSHVQPLSELVSTTEVPNVSIANSSNNGMSQQPFFQEYSSPMTVKFSTQMAKFDNASAIIDSLVMKKPLPEKGKLLQAVMEAGPLLETLLVVGPLPQWCNPPPAKPPQVPPVPVQAHEYASLN